jgi:hypothetical protein
MGAAAAAPAPPPNADEDDDGGGAWDAPNISPAADDDPGGLSKNEHVWFDIVRSNGLPRGQPRRAASKW